MKKAMVGIMAIIAVVAVAIAYGGYIEDYIEKTGENTAVSRGIDDVCFPNVIDWNAVYDDRGIVEITVKTEESTRTFRRSYPTENQLRFMQIGEVKEFETCEECEAFCETLAESLGYEKGNRT